MLNFLFFLSLFDLYVYKDVTIEIYFYSLIKTINFSIIQNTAIKLTHNLILENHFFLVMLNTYIYTALLFLMFCLFFLFDFRIFKTLSEFKFFRTTGFINMVLTTLFLSLAGIPPLLGFLSKILFFFILFWIKNFSLTLLIVIFNLFVMYFYIQNIRFIYSRTSPNIFLYHKYKVQLNNTITTTIVFMFFINISGFFFFEYFSISLNQFIFFLRSF